MKPIAIKRYLPAAALLVFVLITAPSGYAAQGGYTNYVPGLYGSFAVAVAPEPGFYMLNDFYWYTADGNSTRVVQDAQVQADINLDVGAYIATGLYVTDKTLFGGRYAFGGEIPVIYTDLSGQFDVAGTPFPFDDDGVGIGDPGIVPIALFWNFGNFHLNAYEFIVVPLGQYDKNELINAGLNFWTFDTVVAGTYLHPEKGFELSAAVGYIFNTENQDIDYKTGQEFHVDYMINQYLSETFAIGLQGFYYKQTTADSGSAVLIEDFKGEAAGIGPAVTWGTQVKDVGLYLTAKWITEFHAENRLEGDHFFLNVTLDF
jgi:hypothetical protein